MNWWAIKNSFHDLLTVQIRSILLGVPSPCVCVCAISPTEISNKQNQTKRKQKITFGQASKTLGLRGFPNIWFAFNLFFYFFVAFLSLKSRFFFVFYIFSSFFPFSYTCTLTHLRLRRPAYTYVDSQNNNCTQNFFAFNGSLFFFSLAFVFPFWLRNTQFDQCVMPPQAEHLCVGWPINAVSIYFCLVVGVVVAFCSFRSINNITAVLYVVF